MTQRFNGACFCGAVEISVSGECVSMGYCHCRSCRSWSGAPVFAFSLWPIDLVRVTKGAEHVASFSKTPATSRQFCRLCGGHLMVEFRPMKLMDVCVSMLPTLPFAPTLHVNYAETVLPMRDGLPKFRDLSVEGGGSGELVPE